MATTNDGRSETSKAATEAKPGPRTVSAPVEQVPHPASATPSSPTASPPPSSRRKWLLAAGIVIGLAVAVYFLIPWVMTALNTVSTDDAYINDHVTFVAPRVAGQVKAVLVDDNKTVEKGKILVVLDKEPFQVQVNIKKAAVVAAERDLVAAKSQTRQLEGQARQQRWLMKTAVQNVAIQSATLKDKNATLVLARDNLKRGEELAPKGGISKEDLDQRKQAVEQALQAVYSARAALDLPIHPAPGHELTDVPADLDQTHPGVRAALASLVQSVAQLGLPLASTDATPRAFLADFVMRDFRPAWVFVSGMVGAAASPMAGPLFGISNNLAGKGDIDRILEQLVPEAPIVLQAEAKIKQAQADLAQAELNLRYCDIVSEIDGQVTRRNVNPGNYVQVGQSLMAVRSLTEVWVDANFKETQLANLRIGQPVKIEVDMYGRHREFEGRITGFTMGTGQTLALLPPQNATGNFVKIVQRLPVRIEFNEVDQKESPLFIGLSCSPYVYFRRPLIGNDPGKGDFLQPFAPLPRGPAGSKP